MLDLRPRADRTPSGTYKFAALKGLQIESDRFWCWWQMDAVPRKSPPNSASHSRPRLATGAVSWRNAAFTIASLSCGSQSERERFNRDRVINAPPSCFSSSSAAHCRSPVAKLTSHFRVAVTRGMRAKSSLRQDPALFAPRPGKTPLLLNRPRPFATRADHEERRMPIAMSFFDTVH